ncbi:MAG: SDR family NAD(P)-dependent oxidoreductase [Gemmataceae bacterium]
MDAQLHSKTAIVTGASGGIGAAVVQALLHENARVAVHYLSNRPEHPFLTTESLERSRLENLPPPPQFLPMQADLTQADEVERLFTQTDKAFGPPEVLIACAGKWVSEHVPIWEMSEAQWEDTWAVNVKSVFLCVRRFLQGVRDHKLERPAIVLVGSTSGSYGEAGHCDYAASKAALMFGLMRSVMNEMTQLAPCGRINVVSPGWVRTSMADSLLQNKNELRRTLQTNPLRKLASPADVANTVVFLASAHLAGHITGEIVQVSGGFEGGLLFSEGEIDLDAAT